MAVQRQQNWLGQQRVDVQHARAIESAMCYDFDVAAQLVAARVPTVVSGFTFQLAGAVGNDAEELVLQTAGSMVLHYFATESGSFFRVDDDRDDEVLGPTNTRVDGSFTPGTVNYVGLDLIRTADDSTADDVQFLVPSTNVERSQRVPLARSMDYRLRVSTNEFGSTPGVLPLALVETDSSNRVLTITDARWLLFRLGAGGSSPSAVSPFAWPGGRNESDPDATVASIAGDRSIFSLHEWMAAAMTRIWETGGGEFWYSLTADRNVKFTASDTFATTLEPFEWDGTNLHWKALTIKFDNSNGATNTVAVQNTSSPGLTNLADGECVYVDLDRTQTAALTPVKAVLQTLGGSTRPGQRWVFAWRVGSNVFVRDQALAVGVHLSAATMTRRGTVRLTANPLDAPSIADPVVPVVLGSPGWVTAGGLSHNTDLTSADVLTGSNLTIGRGTAAGDATIFLHTDGGNSVIAEGNSSNAFGAGVAAMIVSQDEPGVDGSTNNLTLDLIGRDSNAGNAYRVAHRFEVGGAIGMRIASQVPETPAPTAGMPIRSKFYMTTNGLASPNTRDQAVIMGWDGDPTVIWESNPY
jgi:hypothetical protein